MTATYDKAVARFERLLRAPVETRVRTPIDLARIAGAPASSVYRAAVALEAEGFLSRDADGNYVRGAQSARVGWSSRGLGRMALLAPPVLAAARRKYERSFFVASIRGRALTVGAHCLSRGERDYRLQARYELRAPVAVVDGRAPAAVQVVSLPVTGAGAGEFFRVAPLIETADGVACVGLVPRAPTQNRDAGILREVAAAFAARLGGGE